MEFSRFYFVMTSRIFTLFICVLNHVAYTQSNPNGTIDLKEIKVLSPFAGGARDDGSGFSINGVGYFGCGSDANFTARKDWYAYHPSDQNWSQIADLPAMERQYATALSNGSSGYVFGGILQDGSFSNQCFSYKPQDDGWKEIKAPLEARGKAVGFAIGPMLYFGTGIGDSILYNDWWRLNTVDNEWEQLDSLPFSPRYEMVGFSANGFGYLLLGRDEERTYREVWQFNPINGVWRSLSDFPGLARTFSCAIAEPYGAFVAGGMSDDGNLLDEVYHYDARQDEWKLLPQKLPSITRGMEGFSVGHSVYFIGGMKPQFTRTSNTLEFVLGSERFAPAMSVWPNPVRGDAFLQVQIPFQTEGTIELYNTNGAQLMQFDISSALSNPVDFSGLKNGVYFLKLSSNEINRVVPIIVSN
ncbi:MAG: hypothetical protein Salg2KO_02630 [Salibacteraceae bacterium]